MGVVRQYGEVVLAGSTGLNYLSGVEGGMGGSIQDRRGCPVWILGSCARRSDIGAHG